MGKLLVYLLLALTTLSFAMPSNPTPESDATDVNIYGEINWDTDETQLMGNIIYLGIDQEAVNNSDESVKVYDYYSIESFDFTNLDYGTDYYWKVVEDDGFGLIESPVWLFSTKADDGIGMPTNPVPNDLATGVSVNGTISWDNPWESLGDEYNAVYFGTDYDLVQSMDASVAVYTPGGTGDAIDSYSYTGLEYETTYYWKVKEYWPITEGHVFSFTTEVSGPGMPTNPLPADLATGRGINGTISWDNPSAQDLMNSVYFSSNEALVNSMDASVRVYAPAGIDDHIDSYDYTGLEYETTYYWRVEESTQGGDSDGPVWSFTTEKFVGISNPTPVDGAVDVQMSGSLNWQSNLEYIEIEFIYLATNRTLVENLDESVLFADYNGFHGTCDYSNLESGTTYYWVVLDLIGGGTVPSPVWSFTTESGPGMPTNPLPADLATGIGINGTISWDNPSVQDLMNSVYFSSNEALVNSMDESVLVYTPGGIDDHIDSYDYTGLEYETTYYWRVKEFTQGGDSDGPVWSFTTEANPYAPTDPVPANLAAGVDKVTTVSWTTHTQSENNIIYFGTDQALVNDMDENVIIYNGDFSSSDLLDLDYGTTYYWRSSEFDGYSYEISPVWSFTTEDIQGPGLPTAPSPADLTTEVAFDGTLSWDNPEATDTNALYFGTDYDLVVSMDESVLVYQSPEQGIQADSYTYADLALETTYYWKVVEDYGYTAFTEGTVWSFTTSSTIAAIDENLAEGTALSQNYPNPFNPSTTISFNLKNKSVVSLKIYNAAGKVVAELAGGAFVKGAHSLNFDGANYVSGVYYYTLKADNQVITKSMLLVK